MCGFCGFYDPAECNGLAADAIGVAMGAAIAQRGPDGAGTWCDEVAGLTLVHRRLAILDLSEAGMQPMSSFGQRYKIVYNGEIYNHTALRGDLAQGGHSFNWIGHSDTETLLACIETWGLEEALQRVTGMFAFALWDADQLALYLARDRMGEKPLYYGIQNNVFMFGSDLNALRRHPSFAGRIDRSVLPLFLRHSYVPAPHSIYEGIFKLEPGRLLRVRFEDGGFTQKETTYWSLSEVAARGAEAPFGGNVDEARDALDATLTRGVESQLISDVPVGAFLSGGVDSSTVVALMQKVSTKPVRSFSIGFKDEAYDESRFAASVAAYLGTDHLELIVSPQQALDVIPAMPGIYSEPFADSSQVPTFLVSQLAREHVTVALSGDGADELFAGYSRYLSAWQVWQKVTRLPPPLRRALRQLLLARSPAEWDRLYAWLGPLLPARLRERVPGDKAHKLARTLATDDAPNYFQQVTSLHDAPEKFLLHREFLPTLLSQPKTWPELERFEEVMMVIDGITYLPDDILVKVDRATMACGLEGRAPFLDHRVVELAWSLPYAHKLGSGQGKWLLREVLYRYVPRELIERPKSGFGIPIGEWLRGALRPWAEELLSLDRLETEGYFDTSAIQEVWQEHLSGDRNHQHILWNILMFQAWLEEYHGK